MSLTRPSLILLSAATILANIVVYVVLLYVGYLYSDDISRALAETAPSVFRWEWEQTAVRIVILVVWAITCVFLSIFVASVLTGPLLDLLSERTELILTGAVDPLPFRIGPILYEAVASLVLMLRSLLVGLVATLLLFWIPIVGQIVPLCIAAPFVALSFVAPTAIRHQLTIRDRVQMLRSNRAIMIGFGAPAGVLPFLLVPILTPALVIGGTRMFLALAATGRVPARTSEDQVACLTGQRNVVA